MEGNVMDMHPYGSGQIQSMMFDDTLQGGLCVVGIANKHHAIYHVMIRRTKMHQR